jgi:hypothetical protein
VVTGPVSLIPASFWFARLWVYRSTSVYAFDTVCVCHGVCCVCASCQIQDAVTAFVAFANTLERVPPSVPVPSDGVPMTAAAPVEASPAASTASWRAPGAPVAPVAGPAPSLFLGGGDFAVPWKFDVLPGAK